jgi:hypothetical protein
MLSEDTDIEIVHQPNDISSNEMEENNGIMTNNEVIDIFAEKFDDNPDFCIYGYKFNDMNIEITLNVHERNNLYYIETSCSIPYEHKNDDELCCTCCLQNDIPPFLDIKSAIKFLLCDLRKKYTYSKVFDTITLKETVDDDERNMIADSILCNQPKIDKCCVCYDVNLLYTKCDHNLCRICYYKNENRKCPVCRTNIKSTRY